MPTKLFVRKFAMQLFVSIVGILPGDGFEVMPPVCGREALELLYVFQDVRREERNWTITSSGEWVGALTPFGILMKS